MATPIKTPALAPRPNWIETRILFYEQQHGPLPDDVVETQGQNLVTQDSTPVPRSFQSEQSQFNHELERELDHLIWHQGRRVARYGQDVAEEWPIGRTPPRHRRARRKRQRAKMRAEYEAGSVSESDLTDMIDETYPLSESHSSSSSRVPSPPPASTELTIATEPHDAEKAVASDSLLDHGEHTNEQGEAEHALGVIDELQSHMQDDPKHINKDSLSADRMETQTETIEGAEVIHDATPVTRRRTSQQGRKLGHQRQGNKPEHEPLKRSENLSQSPMPKHHSGTAPTQKGKRKRPAPVEDDFAPRRSERLRIKREQLHEEGEGLSHVQARAEGPVKKRARLTTKQAPREDRHGVRRSQRLIRQEETTRRQTFSHSLR